LLSCSNLGDLVGDDDRVVLGDPLAAGAFVVVAAGVLLRVPVRAAEGFPAAAPEPQQAHFLAARRAPVRSLLHRLRLRGRSPGRACIVDAAARGRRRDGARDLGLLLRRRRRLGNSLRRRRLLVSGGGRGRRRRGAGGGVLAVALGAHAAGRGVAEVPAPVRTPPGGGRVAAAVLDDVDALSLLRHGCRSIGDVRLSLVRAVANHVSWASATGTRDDCSRRRSRAFGFVSGLLDRANKSFICKAARAGRGWL